MKNIRPIYIYGIGIIISALVFIFLSQKDVSDLTKDPTAKLNKEMPADKIHQGLQKNDLPGASNVMPDIMKKMQALKEAADKKPADTAKIKAYADFLSAAHQQDKALEYYEKILKINPKRIDVMFSVAYLNYMKRDFAGAENYLNKIISYDKNNLQAYYNLGAIAASKGDKAKAKEIWSKLIQQHPQDKLAALAKQSINQI